MKKLVYTIVLSVLALAWSGCTKLEEDPKGLMAPEGFFKTPDDVQAVVMGAYAEWNTTQIEKSFWLTLQLRSDMIDIGDVGTAAERIAINNFSMDANNSLISESWVRLYQSISAANTAIKAARSIDADAKVKSELEAKARFIRAFTYFHLVRCFGDVPYLDTPIESAEQLNAITRTAESDVYKKIVEDLIFAKGNLPAKNTADVKTLVLREVQLPFWQMYILPRNSFPTLPLKPVLSSTMLPASITNWKRITRIFSMQISRLPEFSKNLCLPLIRRLPCFQATMIR